MLWGAREGGRDPSCPVGCESLGLCWSLGPESPGEMGMGMVLGGGSRVEGDDRAVPCLGAALSALFGAIRRAGWPVVTYVPPCCGTGCSSKALLHLLGSPRFPPASAVAGNAVPVPDTARATGASHLCVRAPSVRAFSPGWGDEHCIYHPLSLPTAAPRSRGVTTGGC